jgi:hypothetical protein
MLENTDCLEDNSTIFSISIFISLFPYFQQRKKKGKEIQPATVIHSRTTTITNKFIQNLHQKHINFWIFFFISVAFILIHMTGRLIMLKSIIPI